MKQAAISKLQERERSLTVAFQASVAGNQFEEFLIKVFKKTIKRVKKKEQTGQEGGRKCVALCVVSIKLSPAKYG